jgi:hypothetical protein
MNRRTLISMLAAAGSWTAMRDVFAADPKAPALTVDGRAARFGVYLGAGCTGSKKLVGYEAWLGRRVDQVIEFLSWEVLRKRMTWGVSCWKKAGRQVVYSLPMLPPDRSATLAQGANGRFDDLYRHYAELLVRAGYSQSIIRIGWEFNAKWYAWDASQDPEAWIAYWRRIASTMRGVPGAAFKFDWCPAASAKGFVADRAYPGDDVVDIVGLDYYNTTIDKNADTPELRWQARMNMQHGLKWQRDFARSHRKPMSLPEWGTGVHKQWGGPPDDPYFIDGMADWIENNAVAYHGYWEHKSKDYATRMADGSQPKASAEFRRRFGGSNVSSEASPLQPITRRMV